MTRLRFTRWLSGKSRLVPLAGFVLATLSVCGASFAQSEPAHGPAAARRPAISRADFSRMVRLFSEQEGSFPSENFVSNETGYLYIVDKLRQMGVSGGAYIGVGPEQNFTYIAKVRPEIAFIVDIRREAIIQHLMYKAIFQMAQDRPHFLSLLFSKPLDGKFVPGSGSSVEDLMVYFSTTASDDKLFESHLAAIHKTIEKEFEIPLSEQDSQLLERVCRAFERANVNIFTRWSDGGYFGAFHQGFPTLKDLFLATDANGEKGNFMASEADFDFIRDLQRSNRIIPVVGDFAGKKALAVVADYLKENGYTVSAFYTSNVEQYLFGDQVFDGFAANILKLPINDKSVFIRAVRGGYQSRSFRMATRLEKIDQFVNDYNQGLYTDYGSLITAHSIGGDEP